VPAGLVSCRIRSWGSALQSLAPVAWPYAVSGAAPLLTLETIERHPVSPEASEDPPAKPLSRADRDEPESFVAFRGLLPATIRHSHASGLDRCAARSSPGLRALQGSPPHCGGAAFTEPPLMGFSPQGANDLRCDPPGSRPQRGWLVSLETAGPPGLHRLVTFTNVWVGRGSGVASSGSGVRCRPLSNLL
jgi:hypothetical protein